MKTLIVFASKYGTSEKCAHLLSEKLPGEVSVRELPLTKSEIEEYDTVVCGGSIYAGKIHSRVRKFCRKNLEKLLSKRVGLFICCLDEDRREEQMLEAFPEKLLKHAICRGYFGYTLPYQKMNFIVRFIVKKVTQKPESTSNINEDNIEKFSEELVGGE